MRLLNITYEFFMTPFVLFITVNYFLKILNNKHEKTQTTRVSSTNSHDFNEIRNISEIKHIYEE